ncbi:hypothetical protein NLO83_07680 [Pseudomonas tremae]|uniref:hypothetical protein n=1 Tax=Pseudomonas syringae group TaxID=136849 RepID=UPI0001AF38B8|nr:MULTISPECIES: hypothetical protein [Pseudomonas syringae group]MCQ3015484.1 hypothetical protein [Pseudomonas tremae]QGL56009.1 hypothetical protein POR16_06475 [Pseudomonas coronafaciens pv. oryzae str. 1_6]RMM38552.1 hypothetical protein ALQ80_02657 [Pseudomonas coronafaciens pv. oryzae]
MRVISSGTEAAIAARQLDKKIAMKMPASTTSSAPVKSSGPSVTISGEALLKQRVFGLADPNRAAPMPGKELFGRNLQSIAFFNRDDRRFPGSVYERARDQGADLTYVDPPGLRLAGSGEKRQPDNDTQEQSASARKTTKPKEITLESLREDMRKSFLKAMGVESFSSLFELLFKNKR